MNIIRTLEAIVPSAPCSLALGTFDGLHRGHRAVIAAALEKNREKEPLETGVFTFQSSPSGEPAVLTGRDKEKLLASMSVDRLYSMEFSRLRDLSPEAFVREILFERCRAKRLCCGEDFRFGKNAAGTVELLEKLCREADVELKVSPPVLDSGEKISSTAIRRAVEVGDIPRANRLLGRPFGFSLEVIHGNHIGTGLGMPTINQALPGGFVLPPFGVYASWAKVEDRYFFGVTNIGVKPTVGSDRVLSETWLPQFSGDLYGRHIRLFLLSFIRPERKFGSLEELKAAVSENARQAKELAENSPPPLFGLGQLQNTIP